MRQRKDRLRHKPLPSNQILAAHGRRPVGFTR
jgi:hypothetical protein